MSQCLHKLTWVAARNARTIFRTSDGRSTMKSSQKRLLLLTWIVALAFVGPINAPAATVNIFDFSSTEDDPSGDATGLFTLSSPPVQGGRWAGRSIYCRGGIYCYCDRSAASQH